jgi:hypothetical protein
MATIDTIAATEPQSMAPTELQPVAPTEAQPVAPTETKPVAQEPLFNFKVSELAYAPIRKNPSGSKSVYVNTGDAGDRLRFGLYEQRTSPQTIIWDVSCPPGSDNPERLSLDVSVNSDNVAAVLRELDARNVDEAVKHSKEWLGKECSRASIQNMYFPLLRDSVNDGPPHARTKVNVGEARPVRVLVAHGSIQSDELDCSDGGQQDLTRNSKALVIVETNGLWFSNSGFGMSLTATDVVVWPSSSTTGSHAFNLPSVTMNEWVNPKRHKSGHDAESLDLPQW